MPKEKEAAQYSLITANMMSNEKAKRAHSFLLYNLVVLAAVFTTNACNTNHQNEQDTMQVDISTLHVGPVVHDTLSAAQLEKISFIYNTFTEVQPSTLEETITDFKRDQNPDNEISIWLSMANAYQKFVQKKGTGIAIASKKEAYKLVLLRSEMSSKEEVAEAKLKLLSPADVSDILSFYDQAREHIKVYSK
jgi:hypothetical protein